MPNFCFPLSFKNHDGFLRLKVPPVLVHDSFLFFFMRTCEKRGASNVRRRKGCWGAANHLQTEALSAQMTWEVHLKMAPTIRSFLFEWENLPSLCLTLNTLMFTSRSAYSVRTNFNTARMRGVACSQANIEKNAPGRGQRSCG